MSRIADEVGFVHLRVHSAYSLLEGALPLKRLVDARRRRPHAGARHRRYRQPVRRARIRREDGREGHPADHRLPDGGRFRRGRRGPARRGAARPAARRHRADRRRRDRLLEPRPPGLRFLHATPTPASAPHVASPTRSSALRRADRADRRARRAGRSGASPAGQAELAGERLDRLAARSSATGSMSSCSATARAAEQAVEPQLIELAYARGLPLVATNEAFFPTREDYEAHDALICHRRGRGDRRRQPPAADAGALFQDAAPRWSTLFADLPEAIDNTVEIAMRCACWPQTRKPILPRFAGAGADPEAADAAEALVLREAAEAGLARRLADHGLAPGLQRGRLPRAPRLRARRHRADEISGLLPDRRRLHPVGEGAGHSGRAGPRLGRRLGGRLGAHHHRPRSAALLRCSSSASSIPTACRCRTSTSTSARTGATR